MNHQADRYARAIDALNRADWSAALGEANRLLDAAPEHAGVHFVAGVAALNLQQMPRALRHLEISTKLNPSRPDYAAQWARALAAAALIREALAVARQAWSLGPRDTMTLDTLGVVFSLCSAHEEALAAFRQASELNPAVASYRFNVATSLSILNRMSEAESEYEACIARDTQYWKAHLALAQLRKQDERSNHLPRLHELDKRVGSNPQARMYLSLALAKELEDLGQFAESMNHLRIGKRAGGEGRGYRFERDRTLFDALIGAFPEPVTPPGGHPSDEPIFIIGMPRTGTTLVDRILSSHPDVQSMDELPNFGFLLKRMSGSPTRVLLDADTLSRAERVDPTSLGRAYVESTRPRTGQLPRFTDKLPHNFLYAGHIAKALPRARIVCLRRDPVDTCLSNFRQLFAQGSQHYDYSFDLLDTGRYYLQFERLMRHWKRVLPGRILEVEYEQLVENQESETRRLLHHCGLEWNESSLAFDKNTAPVATASLAQVRKPLYRTAIHRWKRYEGQLDDLLELLEQGGVSIK